jgi:putative toxin-antitoxin system antitoxin component (TIGR02293 family)
MAKKVSGKALTARSSKSGTFRAAARKHGMFLAFVTTSTGATTKISVIRNGVNARVVDDMAGYLDVAKSEIFKVLRTPESTAHNLVKGNRPLDAGASERVVRVADIARLTEDTFGGQEAARRWLKTPNLALGSATPLSMLDTEPGALEVRRILASIDHGGVV